MGPPRPNESTWRRSQWLDRHWLAVLAAGASLLLGVAAIGRFVREPFYVSTDSALFQHAGWYIAQGATPYVDFFDVKPPLIYAVTTGLAFLTGGNMAALHVLSVALASAAVVGGVVVVGLLAYRLTNDAGASLLAGATTFVLPSLYLFPSAGIRPKYLAFLFGATALLLAVSDRPTASGAAGAMGAAFWQLGAPIALLVVAMGWQRDGARAAGRTVLGGGLVAVAVIAPFVLAGLTVPLFVEAVLTPVVAVEQYTVQGRLFEIVLELGYGVLVLPVGALGWFLAAREDLARYWWVGAGGAVYALQLFLEFQGGIEAVLLLLFLSLGVGLLYATARTPARRRLLVGLVVVLAVGSLVWTSSPVAPGEATVEERYEATSVPNYESLPATPEDAPSMQTIYWEQRRPERCHYRFGQKQRYFLQETGGSLETQTCGEWPYDDPPVEWLVGRFVGG